MQIHVDEIFVYEYKLNVIKYCPNCKICLDIQCFRSLNKHKEYNKVCRRCLDSTKGYKQNLCLYEGLLNAFFIKLFKKF